MAEATHGPKARFSDRVDDYIKYRPHYPQDVLQAVEAACGLRPEHTIADIGCAPACWQRYFWRTAIASWGLSPIAKCASVAGIIWPRIPTSAWSTVVPKPLAWLTRAPTSSSPGRRFTGFGPTIRASSSRAF